MAIVTDHNPDRTVKALRVYHSMWPLTASHTVHPIEYNRAIGSY